MNVNSSDGKSISELLIVIVVEVHEGKGDGVDRGGGKGVQWLWQ